MTALADLVPDYVRRFAAYIPSQPDDELCRLYGVERLWRLNNNENPLGPPEAARRALAGLDPAAAAIYPSGDAWHLRRRLAALHGLDPQQILVGNGANEVIAFVIKAFCEPGDCIVTADRTFAVYEWVAAFSGIEPVLVPLRDFGFDAEAMLAAAARPRCKIVFVCNPNNPTGSWWDRATLARFLAGIGGRAIVVLDEAYAEFVEDDDFPDGLSLIAAHPNLVVFRTFSKMFGLAGLRIGWMAGSPEVLDMVRRTCVVYSVNGPAQVAALAAAGDLGHVRATNAAVAEARRHVAAEMRALDLPVVAGAGNFLMVRLPIADTAAHRRLMAQGVMIRSMTGFRFPNWIRVSLALPEPMEAFVKGVRSLL